MGRSLSRLVVVGSMVIASTSVFGGVAAAPVGAASPAACGAAVTSPPGHDFNGDGYQDAVIGDLHARVLGIGSAGGVEVLPGSPTGPTTTGGLFLRQGPPPDGIGDHAEINEYFGEAVAWGDFNADGCDDLAIGAPGESPDGKTSTGVVRVLYGSPSGLTITGERSWSEGTAGLDGQYVPYARFGRALAVGDFNGDGYQDLAVGAPGETVTGHAQAGAVRIIPGSSTGLVTTHIRLTQDSLGAGRPGANNRDHFGNHLTVGNFNGDLHNGHPVDDLAIDAPFESVAAANAGAVVTVYGSTAGLSFTGAQLFYEGVSGIQATAHSDDHFGWATTAGDFNGDGYEDLAVGSPASWPGTPEPQAGLVFVLPGSPSRLDASHAQRFSESVKGAFGAGDAFGNAIAAGDFNSDGHDDLAIGAPFEDVNDNKILDAGTTRVLYGSPSGVTKVGAQQFLQGAGGMPGSAELGDNFGSTLITGDFDGAHGADLEIAARGESLSDGTVHAGLVHFVFSASGGLSSVGNKYVVRASLFAAGAAHDGDYFGECVNP